MQFRQREEQLNAVIESNPNIFTKKDIGGNSVYYCPGSEYDWFDCYAIHIPAGDGPRVEGLFADDYLYYG